MTNDLLQFSLNRKAEVDEGQYAYKLLNVKVENDVHTSYGIKQQISFEFSLKIGEETRTFVKKFNYSMHPESRFMKFMSMICKAYGKNQLNLRELIGTSGILTITHGSDENGNVYENITDITLLSSEGKQ